MTQLILATDMARHSEIIESFKAKQETSFDYKNKDSLDTVNILFKVSYRISNICNNRNESPKKRDIEISCCCFFGIFFGFRKKIYNLSIT